MYVATKWPLLSVVASRVTVLLFGPVIMTLTVVFAMRALP